VVPIVKKILYSHPTAANDSFETTFAIFVSFVPLW
jgi:hypothetical protein